MDLDDNFKPVYKTSDKDIIIKLHGSALDRANKKKGGLVADCVNTAVPKDADVKFEISKSGNYQFAVAVEFKKYDDKLTASKDKNQQEKDKLLTDVHMFIREYFLWFAGKAASSKIKKEDVKEFKLDQKKRKIEVKSGEIVPATGNLEPSGGRKPYLGFSVTYTLTI